MTSVCWSTECLQTTVDLQHSCAWFRALVFMTTIHVNGFTHMHIGHGSISLGHSRNMDDRQCIKHTHIQLYPLSSAIQLWHERSGSWRTVIVTNCISAGSGTSGPEGAKITLSPAHRLDEWLLQHHSLPWYTVNYVPHRVYSDFRSQHALGKIGMWSLPQ